MDTSECSASAPVSAETAAAAASDPYVTAAGNFDPYVTIGDMEQLLNNFERGEASPPLDRDTWQLDANGRYPHEAGYDPHAEYDPSLETGDDNWRDDCWNYDLHQHGTQRLHPEQLVFNEEPSTGEPAAEEPTQPTYDRAGDEFERLLAEETAATAGRAR